MSLTLFNDNITITRKGYMKTIAYPNKPHSLSAGLLTAIAIFSLASSNITYADDYQRNATEAYAKEVPHQITSVWTKGVTPLTPEQFRYNNEDVIHAPYLAHQGWYDITKAFDGKDNLLCGAATAGNMLHWWFDQNKTEIEAYLSKHPEKQKIIFNNQELFDLKAAIDTKDSQTNSQLFNYFRDKAFPNLSARQLGVMPDLVLDMFINGYYLNVFKTQSTDVNRPYQDKDKRGGIFDAVFTRGDQTTLLTARHDLKNKGLNDISTIIKQELTEGRALALSHTYANVSISHVINLWGADFNAEGNLEAIYVTDSDANASIGMKKYFVGINAHRHVAISAKKIEGENIGAQVLGLFTLSSGKDIWQKLS